VRKYSVCFLPFSPCLSARFNSRPIPFAIGAFWGLRAEFHPLSVSPGDALRDLGRRLAPARRQTGAETSSTGGIRRAAVPDFNSGFPAGKGCFEKPIASNRHSICL